MIITHEYPYHIVARSNNKEWFYLPINDCWEIFSFLLIKINLKFKFQIHSFILMNNHYHLIGTASEHFTLPQVMEWFQRSANRIINDKAKRVNHLFGGPYRATLINGEAQFYQVTKYLYRNPISAKLTSKVEDYPYTTIVPTNIPLSSPSTGIAAFLPKNYDQLLIYLNESYTCQEKEILDAAIKKSIFKVSSRISNELKDKLIFCM